jgi:NADPH:quinone reductase-like Zn-dependent oxidoreductase
MLRAVGFGLKAPKVQVRGIDVAGTVEAIGDQVTEFQVGDEVFGTCEGAFASYTRASENNLALKPANLTFEQAAVLPTSSFAALQALVDRGEIRSGQRALIVGASGGVGAFAVQIAKAFGGIVTGVCSAKNMDLVWYLGADHVVDYGTEDFIRSGLQYDLIIDTAGKRSLSDLRRVLSPTGILVLVGGEGGNRVLGGVGKWIHALLMSRFVSQRLRPLTTVPNKKDLLFIKQLAEIGKLTPIIDRTFDLSEVPDAFRYMTKRLSRGKIVITIRRCPELFVWQHRVGRGALEDGMVRGRPAVSVERMPWVA